MRQGRTLQYAAGWRRRVARSSGGEEPHDRQENAKHSGRRAGSQSHAERAGRAEGSHGYQGSQDQCASAKGFYEFYGTI